MGETFDGQEDLQTFSRSDTVVTLRLREDIAVICHGLVYSSKSLCNRISPISISLASANRINGFKIGVE